MTDEANIYPEVGADFASHGAVNHSEKQYVRFSNRPVGVKHFQTIHRCGVDVTHGLALLYGIGTRALPSWDPRTGRNNL